MSELERKERFINKLKVIFIKLTIYKKHSKYQVLSLYIDVLSVEMC